MLPSLVESACVPTFESAIVTILSFCEVYSDLHQLSSAAALIPTFSGFEVAVIHKTDNYSFSDLVIIIRRATGYAAAQAEVIARKLLKVGVFLFRCDDMDSQEQFRGLIRVFRQFGFKYCLATSTTVSMEMQVISTIKWLSKLSQTSDDMCELIGLSFSSEVLVQLIGYDPYLTVPMQQALHDLLVNLMSNKSFKGIVAHSYAQSYEDLATAYGTGLGVADSSFYTISVQYLNRENFVMEMSRRDSFMLRICIALNILFDFTATDDEPRSSLNLNHPVFEYRRYYPIIADIKVRA